MIDFLHPEVVNSINHSGLSNIIEIVKHEPSIVRVDNYYATN
jgi:hypothetical protein